MKKMISTNHLKVIKKRRPLGLRILTISVIMGCITIFSACLIVFLAIFENDGSTAPVDFSLDNPKAAYTIKKTEGSTPTTPDYWVNYNNDIEVFVGNSKIPLDPFVGKRIRIRGSYTGRVGKEQCIVHSCHRLEGAMIDIDSIDVVK